MQSPMVVDTGEAFEDGGVDGHNDDASDDGNYVYYMVMLARSQRGSGKTGGDQNAEVTTERTQIKRMQANHVLTLLIPRNYDAQKTPLVDKRDSQWHVVVCIGPMNEPQAAYVNDNWGTTVRGIVSKAAQADAISTRIGVPGYADFRRIFGPNFHRYVKVVPIDSETR